MIWQDGWEEKLKKVIETLKSLKKATYVTLTISGGGVIGITAVPDDNEEEKRELMTHLTPLVGRLEKQVSGENISLVGNKDGIDIQIMHYDKCQIVGYVEVEVPETISTGHMVKRKVPVSDCELRQGKFSGQQVVIEKKETANV